MKKLYEHVIAIQISQVILQITVGYITDTYSIIVVK